MLIKLALWIVWFRRYPVLTLCRTDLAPIAPKKGLLKLSFCSEKAVFGFADWGDKKKFVTRLSALVGRARWCLQEVTQEVVTSFRRVKGENLFPVVAES